jgi:hypothetical protein
MGIISAQTIPPMTSSRLGFHYFPDTLHYRESDLQTWLPELQELGASWLVLRSEVDRAIPETFLRGLKQARIEPVIQFQFNLDSLPDLKEISTLFEVYARWGVRYLIFFDRPNISAAWPSSGWVQQDLVERFLDRFLPAANLALKMGMIPVFPPLEPGGSYWDTAFLRSALEGIQRRKQDMLIQSLVLSAYAWTGNRSLNWGAGGPERWPQARPYISQTDEGQDQRGFRVFEWYQAVARSVLLQDCPVILLQAGLPGDPRSINAEAIAAAEYVQTCKNITRLLAGEQVDDPSDKGEDLEPISPQVIACNYWLLAADPSSQYHRQAWFQVDGGKHALVGATRALHNQWKLAQIKKAAEKTVPVIRASDHPIRHYLLLPGNEWGVSDWYLEVIRPFVKKHRPTVGFSPEEAERAVRVTVVGNGQNFPEDLFVRLQKAGCWVEQISGDGINIATELAER